MTQDVHRITVLPYSAVVGQAELRHALEIGHIAGLGVLATGQRGTAKSTTIRAFAMMLHQDLPVTLPLGATDDRVLGGWDVGALLGDQKDADPWREGLLEQADRLGLLYVDEVNLLEDHIVNIILDTAATGILTVQRDHAQQAPKSVDFALVGSMNPDEGPLRPQLLDRFGLVVAVRDDNDRETRKKILQAVLAFDVHRHDPESTFMRDMRRQDDTLRERLRQARSRYPDVSNDDQLIEACAAVAEEFHLVGHRGEQVMLQAARAQAALNGDDRAGVAHLRPAAKAAIMHRRPGTEAGTLRDWAEAEDDRLERVLTSVSGD
ncbi:AAA family ATPase [Solwaraspora sp. WMMD792]|uniref:AAA family ATPase n=1 Tax=Solwaraspora sp. WMMD792 TaxID=3016099 RepID=UPI0024173F18|nr:AAA family ATPase [Solwaraspora sp. WMMD792]MDG4773608.1 AAA family ATPase [Solwaraspora sp. WMMD792]